MNLGRCQSARECAVLLIVVVLAGVGVLLAALLSSASVLV
jgi:hypothetical protein